MQNAKYCILLALLIALPGMLSAQKYNQETDDFDPQAPKKDKFGIRVGLTFSSLLSDELENTTINRGYQGAFYYRVNLFKNFHLNPEFGASIRGAKFKNADTGYTHISLLYFDFSLLGMINLNSRNDHTIIIGGQVSRLMRSSLFLGDEPYPSYLQLPFKTWDYYAVAGYHFNLQYIGFQVCLRYGLRNIAGDFQNFNRQSQNNSSQFGDVRPSLRGVRDVRNLSVDLSLYF